MNVCVYVCPKWGLFCQFLFGFILRGIQTMLVLPNVLPSPTEKIYWPPVMSCDWCHPTPTACILCLLPTAPVCRKATSVSAQPDSLKYRCTKSWSLWMKAESPHPLVMIRPTTDSDAAYHTACCLHSWFDPIVVKASPVSEKEPS